MTNFKDKNGMVIQDGQSLKHNYLGAVHDVVKTDEGLAIEVDNGKQYTLDKLHLDEWQVVDSPENRIRRIVDDGLNENKTMLIMVVEDDGVQVVQANCSMDEKLALLAAVGMNSIDLGL